MTTDQSCAARRGSGWRRANGIVSAAICLVFLPHGLSRPCPLPSAARPVVQAVVWAGVALCALHVAPCVVTGYSMPTDIVRPQSVRKRRHLRLKWATGALLVAVAAAHVGGVLGAWPRVPLVAGTPTAAVALSVHACVGAKSLLKDIPTNPRPSHPHVCTLITKRAGRPGGRSAPCVRGTTPRLLSRARAYASTRPSALL